MDLVNEKWTFLLRKWTFSQVGGSSDRTPLGMGLFNEHYACRLHGHMLIFNPYPNYYSIPHDTRWLASSAVQATTNPAAVVPLQRLGSSAELLLWLAPRKVISSIRPGHILLSISYTYKLADVSINVPLSVISPSCSCLVTWRSMTS